jgi:hypothetical protein
MAHSISISIFNKTRTEVPGLFLLEFRFDLVISVRSIVWTVNWFQFLRVAK